MLATLIQQWARRYLRMTHRPRDSPHDAARIRAFFADGIEKFRLSWVVEAIPTLIHISLFLFFAGLLIYLFNTNYTVFRVIFCGVVVFLGAYFLITMMPIFWRDSPYNSPLSPLLPLAFFGITLPLMIIYVLFFVIFCHTSDFVTNSFDIYFDFVGRIFEGMEKAAEQSARKSSPEKDGHILRWTFDALTQDHDLERFFSCILGFYRSDKQVVENPRLSFQSLLIGNLPSALAAYLDRTLRLNDNLVSESDKVRRIVTCVEVAEAIDLVYGVHPILEWHGQLSVEVGHSLRNRDNIGKEDIGMLSKTIIAIIIADVQGNNDRWIALTADQLGKSEDDIRGYLAHGKDNILLASLIHIIHQIISPSSVVNQDMAGYVAFRFPESLCRFDIQATSLSLQHNFCALWNEIVPETRNSEYFSVPRCILRKICPLYIELHPGTDPILDEWIVSSYPLCNNPDHRPGSTPDSIPATPLPPTNPAHTSPHPSDTYSTGHVTDPPQLPIAPASQQTHFIPATSHRVANAIAAPLYNEPTITRPTTVPGPLSSASLIPVSSSAPTGDVHSPADSINQSDHPPHGAAFSSSSRIPDPSYIAPQPASFSDDSVPTNITVLWTHDDIQDTNVAALGGEGHDSSENLV
jgi:hypothetical protein